MKITTKKILKYSLMPGIMPLLRDLMTGSFGYISFFMAQIYSTARLLPPNHPYLNPANRGRFGIRNVITVAGSNLKFSRENSDQVVIFFLMLIGLAVLAIQFCFLGLALFMQTAHAAMPTNFAGFFVTTNATNDIAFVLLDRVFGVPDMFDSCVEQDVACFNTAGVTIDPSAVADGPFPWPFHLALRSMLQFYSIGLLVIAVLIFIYFVIAVVAETAQTGTPFGRRFNHVWAPIRVVAALGLLIPVANGLNAAQYITLYAAKWGSGFATNGWNLFVQTAVTGTTATLAGDTANLVATPNTPELSNLLEYNTVLQTCWAAYGKVIQPAVNIDGYLVKGINGAAANRLLITSDLTYDQALQFYNYHDILFRFGSCQVQNDNGPVTDCDGGMAGAGGGNSAAIVNDHTEGGVGDECGEVVMQTAGAVSDTVDRGSYYIQEQYFNLFRDLWLGSSADPNAETAADCPVGTNFATVGNPATQMEQWGLCFVKWYSQDPEPTPPIPATLPIPNRAATDKLVNDPTQGYKAKIKTIIDEGVTREIQDSKWVQNMSPLGWAGAAIWYNKIAEMNGAVITAAENLPYVLHYPRIMEDVRKERLKANADASGRDAFQPFLSNQKAIQLPDNDTKYAYKVARVLWAAFDVWTDQYIRPTNNVFIDSIRTIFGVDGLYALKDPKNINVHPLAQLVGLGKSLIESAIRNLGFSLGGSVLGSIASAVGANTIGAAAGMLAGVVHSIAMIALGMGFILFYVVPFLPFIYFFFAVGTWIKGIFEAMVGVPLWALAHIRIDGHGLPGDAAMGGYLMILEIFLRPIAIVFGLLASIILFSAQVRVLHDIWSLVTSNLTGFDVNDATAVAANTTGSLTEMRDVIDDFFFTVIYAIIVYMLGMSSFKLINQIPKQLMRWMGQSVDAFNDGVSDTPEGLVGKIGTAEQVLDSSFGNLRGAVGNLGKSIAERNKAP